MIAVSVVSHGHGTMVIQLIQQLLLCPEIEQIVLTQNIPESVVPPSHVKLDIIKNSHPAGFGANHNAAFQRCTQPFFCVINPDISLPENPFPNLLSQLASHAAALSAPLVMAPDGRVENSIRHFPTPFTIFSKVVFGADDSFHVASGDPAFYPEWVAGMCMLFDSAKFKKINGFDTSFFLYYEDVDICTRLWKSGCPVVACPSTYVVHTARRESHRSLRFLRWHLCSMIRYFFKHFGRLPKPSRVTP